MTAAIEEVEEKTDVISNTDRCDRCMAQAYMWVNGIAGDLYFCQIGRAHV